MSNKVSDRLLLIRKNSGVSQREMSKAVGLSHRAWQKIESGDSIPGGQTLIKLAEIGFSSNWILTGQGPMYLDEPEVTAEYHRHVSTSTDAELLARLNGIISKVYKDIEGRISPEDMGRIAAEKYTSILEASDDPDERLIMAKLFETELRKEIEKRRQNLGNTKASA